MKLREILSRLKFLFRRKPSTELEAEFASHIEHAVDINLAAGMTRSEARRQALVEFGGVEQAREETHRQRPSWFVETLLQDARYAIRGFWRNPAFTLTVLVTLTLGIGATTAVFSVVDRILFRALPYADANHLVSIGLVQSLEKQEFMVGGFFYEWRDNQKPFAAMAAESTNPHACNLVESNPSQLNCVNFQAGFLPMLGIVPALGRNFLDEEDRPGGPNVALISYGLWKSHYGLDVGILERQIDLDGTPVRVIGVLPEGFELPTLQDADVFFPMRLAPAAQQGSQNNGIGQPMRTFARLRPGVSIQQAIARMEPLFRHTQETFIPAPIRKDFHLSIRSLRDRQTQDVQLAAWVLLGSAIAVLLIACANVASLTMARGAAREREFAVRSALGASRRRLIGQGLTEALLLSCVAAAAGLMLAAGLVHIFVAMAPTGVPFLGKAHIDLRIAGFTVILALVSGALFGIIPGLQASRAIAYGARGVRPRQDTAGRGLMVAGQIAISMILLSGAALLLRSFLNIERQHLGMEPGGILTVRLALPDFRDTPVAGMVSRNGPKHAEVYAQAEAAVRRLPGVRAVGWSESLPPGGGFQNARRFADFAPEGQPAPEQGSGGSVRFRGVTPDYFRALRIPIVQGRNFTEEERDSKLQFLILSRLAAERMFPGRNPAKDVVGQRVRMGTDGTWATVAGIAENVRNSGLTDPDLPEVYTLRRNIPSDWGSPVPMMVVATDLSTNSAAGWIRAQMAQVAPTVPVKIDTLAAQVSKLADQPRFETALLGFFALTGLVMAVAGLYGLTAYLTTQRTQEIGIRMALGADRIDILRWIALEGFRLTLLGGAVGFCAALALTQFLRSLLVGVGPRDPTTFVGVALLLGSVALLATFLPARTAMLVDPAVALRRE